MPDIVDAIEESIHDVARRVGYYGSRDRPMRETIVPSPPMNLDAPNVIRNVPKEVATATEPVAPSEPVSEANPTVAPQQVPTQPVASPAPPVVDGVQVVPPEGHGEAASIA